MTIAPLSTQPQETWKEFMFTNESVKKYAQFLTWDEFTKLQEKIAEDFGFDIDYIKRFFQTWVKLSFPEQHGQRMRPSYLGRIWLLDRLSAELTSIISIDLSQSWIFGLINDTFTLKGSKSEHSKIDLWIRGIGDRKIAGNARSKYHGRTYDCVPAPHEEMQWISDALQKLFWSVWANLEKAIYKEQKALQNIEGKDIRNYVDTVRLFKTEAGIHKFNGNNSVISFTQDSVFGYPDMHILRQKLQDNDLLWLVERAHQEAKQQTNRSEYRRSFNLAIYQKEIKDIDSVFNLMLFAIKDIDTFAKKIHDVQLQFENVQEKQLFDNSKMKLAQSWVIRITDIRAEETDQKLLPVYYHIDEKRLSYGSWTSITREEVLKLAAQNKTSWPTAIWEYILLLVLWYILIDDGHDVAFSQIVKKTFAGYLQAQSITSIDCFPMISMKRVIANTCKDRLIAFSDDVLSFGIPSIRWAIAEAVTRF